MQNVVFNPAQLECLSKRELITLLLRRSIVLDEDDVRYLLEATKERLRRVRMRARQGEKCRCGTPFPPCPNPNCGVSELDSERKYVMPGHPVGRVLEASEFTRWIVSSGLFTLFARVLPPESCDLDKLMSDVKSDCDDMWKGREPWCGLSDLESLTAKVDFLLLRSVKSGGQLLPEGNLKLLPPVQGADT